MLYPSDESGRYGSVGDRPRSENQEPKNMIDPRTRREVRWFCHLNPTTHDVADSVTDIATGLRARRLSHRTWSVDYGTDECLYTSAHDALVAISRADAMRTMARGILALAGDAP